MRGDQQTPTPQRPKASQDDAFSFPEDDTVDVSGDSLDVRGDALKVDGDSLDVSGDSLPME